MAVLGQAFLAILQKAGLVPDGTRRLVIYAQFNQPTMFLYKTFADKRLLNIELTPQLSESLTLLDRHHWVAGQVFNPIPNPAASFKIDDVATGRFPFLKLHSISFPES